MAITLDGTNGITFNNSTVQASAGQVLQVVNATSTTNNSTTGQTYVAAGLTASITPKFSTSKILIVVNQNMYNSSNGTEAVLTVYKNGSDLTAGNGFADVYTGSSDLIAQAPMVYLDSPATTSATTYAVYMKVRNPSGTIQSCLRSTINTITLMEIAV
jgi:hypothetical protein